LAHRLQANLVEVRLAGHGLKKEVMQASAEDWLQSVTNATDLAHRLGHQTIILGTSTGAPLGCWAAKALETQFGRPMAIVYMAPNFGIKQSYAWLLTLPGSEWFCRYSSAVPDLGHLNLKRSPNTGRRATPFKPS
jgi:esterase/lipase